MKLCVQGSGGPYNVNEIVGLRHCVRWWALCMLVRAEDSVCVVQCERLCVEYCVDDYMMKQFWRLCV